MPGPVALAQILKGSGSPEGVVPAPIGSRYHRTDTGILYVKVSGYEATGWTAASTNVNVGDWQLRPPALPANAYVGPMPNDDLWYTGGPIGGDNNSFGGSISRLRRQPILTTGPNTGKLLVCATGVNDPRAWLLDMTTGVWRPTGAMLTGGFATRRVCSTDSEFVTLSDGRVLLVDCLRDSTDAGGSVSYSQIYDPVTGTWGTLRAKTINVHGSANFMLLDGRVLSAGGWVNHTIGSGYTTATCHTYDPATHTWSVTGALNTSRQAAGAIFPDGKVILAGGYSANGVLSYPLTTERYDPVSNMWTYVASMPSPSPVSSIIEMPPFIRVDDTKVYYYQYVYNKTANTWANAPFYGAMEPILHAGGGVLLGTRYSGAPTVFGVSTQWLVQFDTGTSTYTNLAWHVHTPLSPISGSSFLTGNYGKVDTSALPSASKAVFRGGPGTIWTAPSAGTITAIKVTCPRGVQYRPNPALNIGPITIKLLKNGLQQTSLVFSGSPPYTSSQSVSYTFLAGDTIEIYGVAGLLQSWMSTFFDIRLTVRFTP